MAVALRASNPIRSMATTGELRAIMEELQLIDIGDAATYLGEEAIGVEEGQVTAQSFVVVHDMAHITTCECTSCKVHSGRL